MISAESDGENTNECLARRDADDDLIRCVADAARPLVRDSVSLAGVATLRGRVLSRFATTDQASELSRLSFPI
jgi:hypothetical protein